MLKIKIGSMYLIASFMAVFLAFGGVASAHTNVMFTQKIRSIPCGVDHIIDANGVEHFFSPKSCGNLVVASKISSNQNSAMIDDAIAPKPVYLDSKSTEGVAGYLLTVNEGDVYSFKLRSDPISAVDHSFQIVEASDSVISIKVSPSGWLYDVKIGERTKIDVSGDGIADIGFIYGGKNEKGDISLQVWFPLDDNKAVGNVEGNGNSIIVSIIALSLTTVATYTHIYSRYRMRAVK